MAMSLSERLRALGIDGSMYDKLMNEYLQLVRLDPSMTMNIFLQTVRDSLHVS